VVERPRIISVTFGVLSPYGLDGCSVRIKSVYAENPDPMLQELCGHVSGEIWMEEVGLGSCRRKLSIPTGSNQEDLIPLTGLADFVFVFRQMLPFDPEAVTCTDERAEINHDRSANQPLQRDFIDLLPAFVEVVRRVDVGARVGTEAEGVDSAPISSWEFEGGFGGEFWVLWVRVDV